MIWLPGRERHHQIFIARTRWEEIPLVSTAANGLGSQLTGWLLRCSNAPGLDSTTPAAAQSVRQLPRAHAKPLHDPTTPLSPAAWRYPDDHQAGACRQYSILMRAVGPNKQQQTRGRTSLVAVSRVLGTSARPSRPIMRAGLDSRRARAAKCRMPSFPCIFGVVAAAAVR